MKRYDSIPKYNNDFIGRDIIAFDKLDGSNLRFEYSRKKGFYKFGTRNIMINEKSPDFGFAIDLFLEKYSYSLEQVFNLKKYKKIVSFVCYAELIGKKSEFGYHDFKNDTFDIVLFDVDQYKNGFVKPDEFINDFGQVGIPDVIYKGKLTKEFIKDINNNKYNLSEGVICKGKTYTKKGVESLFYYKIKTYDWLDRLKIKDIALYNKEKSESY